MSAQVITEEAIRQQIQVSLERYNSKARKAIAAHKPHQHAIENNIPCDEVMKRLARMDDELIYEYITAALLEDSINAHLERGDIVVSVDPTPDSSSSSDVGSATGSRTVPAAVPASGPATGAEPGSAATSGVPKHLERTREEYEAAEALLKLAQAPRVFNTGEVKIPSDRVTLELLQNADPDDIIAAATLMKMAHSLMDYQ